MPSTRLDTDLRTDALPPDGSRAPMHKAETHLQQADRHICEAECRITRQEMLIAKLEQGGQTGVISHVRDLLTAIRAGWDGSWAHRRALLLRGN